jgi:hypothetical protein
MLSSKVVKQRNDSSPLCPIPLYLFEKNQILLSSPLSFIDLIVQMILPTLTALFWSLKIMTLWLEVEIFGNLVPLSFWMISDSTDIYGYIFLSSSSYLGFQIFLPFFLIIILSWYFRKLTSLFHILSLMCFQCFSFSTSLLASSCLYRI